MSDPIIISQFYIFDDQIAHAKATIFLGLARRWNPPENGNMATGSKSLQSMMNAPQTSSPCQYLIIK